MPEPTNPYRTEGSPPGRVDLPIRADAWDEGHAAAAAEIVKWLDYEIDHTPPTQRGFTSDTLNAIRDLIARRFGGEKGGGDE